MAPSRAPSICASCMRVLRLRQTSVGYRAFSSVATPPTEENTQPEQLPRWKQTPAAMKMPLRLRPLPKQPVWRVNEEQEPLDRMYDRFFGNKVQGRDVFPEEVKWLAVTHKSFDHARRGFNDRLAFLGKRIVDLQTSMALLNAPNPSSPSSASPDDIYQHPALDGADNVTAFAKSTVLDRVRLASLASSYGIDKVVRWKPKKSNALKLSGVETVLAHTMYSIIGALALQKGGDVAAKVTRDRILRPLGLR